MAPHGVLKWSKSCPKEPKKSPKTAQGEKVRVEGPMKGTRKKPTNHKKIYTHRKDIRKLPIHWHTAAG